MSHINDLKKALYKQKPIARLFEVTAENGFVGVDFVLPPDVIHEHYRASIIIDNHITEIIFKIPQDEAMDFEQEMPAHLLIRWLV